MISYCTYLIATGALRTTGSCEDAALDLQHVGDGCAIMAVDQPVFPMGWYIDVSQTPPAPAPRPAFTGSIDKTAISADGVDAATLSGLPNATTVTVIGPGRHSRDIVTTGTFAIANSTPGRFTAYVDAFPMKGFQAAITAT